MGFNFKLHASKDVFHGHPHLFRVLCRIDLNFYVNELYGKFYTDSPFFILIRLFSMKYVLVTLVLMVLEFHARARRLAIFF